MGRAGIPLVADISGQGPAVVLLHGQPGTGADWNAVVPLLAGEFTTVVPDRLGWGRTGGAAGGFAANAAAVVALIDRLEIERAVLAAHSWGGGVALHLAATAPDRVVGLVLAASVRPGARLGAIDRALARRPIGDLAAALAFEATGRLLGMHPIAALVDRRLRGPERVALASLTRRGQSTPAWRSFAVEQRALLEELPALLPVLAGIRGPTEVLTGSADRVVPAAESRALAAGIPGAHLTVLSGAGHLLPHEHPAAIAAAVTRASAGRPPVPR